MSLSGTSTPIRDPLPCDTHLCGRCGVTVKRNANRWKGYCRDCKPYAQADGHLTTHRRTIAQCGTPSGYVKHTKHGEPPCPECSTARAEYARAYRQQRKEQAA